MPLLVPDEILLPWVLGGKNLVPRKQVLLHPESVQPSDCQFEKDSVP